jgi:ATP-dependent Clp protease protease subunit
MTNFEKFAKGQVGSLALHDYVNYQNKMKSSMSAYILEERTGNLAVMDIFSRLMIDRIIFLGTEIDDIVANIVNAQLLYLDTDKVNEPIKIFINSPGGECYSGLAILDCMDIVKSPVETVCLGLSASMAAVILAHGTKGYRKATPRSRVMIHQPSGGAGGNTTQISITAKEYEEVKFILAETLAIDTGKTTEEILNDFVFDKWLSAQAALDYGLIDKLVMKK